MEYGETSQPRNHNPRVGGSNPSSATKIPKIRDLTNVWSRMVAGLPAPARQDRDFPDRCGRRRPPCASRTQIGRTATSAKCQEPTRVDYELAAASVLRAGRFAS